MWLSPEGVMLSAPFDVASRKLTGTPVPAMENVVEDFRAAKVAIGPGVAVRVEGTAQRAQMLRFGRDGTSRRNELAGAQDYTTPRFSPDGRRLAFVSNFLGGDLWVADRIRGTLQRLALAGQAIGPEWSPDGRRLVFGYITSASASWDTYAMSADGSGSPEPLIATPQTEFPAGWAADGSLVFWRSTMNRGDILYRDTAGVEHPFVTSAADERSPVLSPDGRWLAYVSDESGRREVYVRQFPVGAGRWQISSEGGIEPRWSKRGREMIYRDRGWLLAVPILPGPELTVGRVDSLFRGSFAISGVRAQFDVSADGSELLLVGVPPESRTLTVILNGPGAVKP
jgi:serine/threonine-protein kinase